MKNTVLSRSILKRRQEKMVGFNRKKVRNWEKIGRDIENDIRRKIVPPPRFRSERSKR
ncbi:MAG: hypothetical protein ACLFQV_11895 [Vulcanimicrobiota bacterium]